MRDSKKVNEHWHRDVEDLLEKSVVEEAVDSISKHFDTAMDSLDKASADLIRRFFDGASLEMLAHEEQLQRKEVEVWVAQIKLKLTQHLREKCKVKQ